jgi:hypothetical protein
VPRFQQHPASLLPAAPGVIDWGLVTDEMRRNKDFRVLLLMGYYDLATPFFAVENTMYQTGMTPSA